MIRAKNKVKHFVRLQLAPLVFLALVCAGLSSPAFAVHHATLQRTHRRHFRWLRWNPMFRPSHESLLLQNAEIDRLDLPRIQDDTELEALKADGSLLQIVSSESLKIEPSLDPSRRYCRPWTLDFVNDLSQAYYNRFHAQIQLNSAVRTVKVQKKLRRHNRNAAPAEGETASSHLAGVTIDLQRRGLSKPQIAWVEHYLFYMKALGLVEPEEERRHWCFHIMVSGHYAEWRETQTIVPMERPNQDQPELPGTEVAQGSGTK
ncbi:MAG TPA: DUF5715 family protein [Candidatus Sulfotelmatobacter sp.]|nr:DUF5715 family protein [Candidatus Sulfotelmatobacter sp.]